MVFNQPLTPARPRPARSFLVCLAVAASAFLPAHAWALGNDLQLNQLSRYDPTLNVFVPDGEGFRSLIKDLGLAFSPKLLAPAETLGSAVTDIGLEFSFNNIAEKRPHWRVVEDRVPDGVLTTTQIHFRKGLFLGMEYGAIITKLWNSEMWAVGVEWKWSLTEGKATVPDVSIRLAANRVVGSGDLSLTVPAGDFIISKEFSLGGNGTLTPYGAFELAIPVANTDVLDPTPTTLSDNPGTEVSFSADHATVPKGVLGLRALVYVFAGYFQVDFGGGVESYSFRISSEF